MNKKLDVLRTVSAKHQARLAHRYRDNAGNPGRQTAIMEGYNAGYAAALNDAVEYMSGRRPSQLFDFPVYEDTP